MRGAGPLGGRAKLFGLGLLFAVYYGAAKLGLSFDAVSGVASTVWPPTGIAIAALFRFGPGLWPAITLGAFLANHQAGMPLAAAAVMALGNTLEAVIAATLLTRYRVRPALDHLRDVLVFVIVAALVSTAVSATGGVIGLWLSGAPVRGFAAVWSVWWLGDVMGALLVAPLLLTWSVRERRGRRRLVEGVALLVLVAAASLLVFAGLLPRDLTELLRQSHVIFPLLIWAAVRFGPRGATLAVVVVATIAVACTAAGLGPFVRATRHEGLLFLQSYMLVEVVTALAMAAAISERRRAVAARDEFISIASHELKTPLTALKLRLDQVTRAPFKAPASRDDEAELATRLQRAGLQVDRLTRLVDDLLDVSRLGSGRLTLTLARLELAEVVRGVLDRLGDELAAAGCSVTVSVEAGIVGQWDRSRLEQVLTNLLTNVIRYAPNAPVTISAERSNGQALLAVTDGGAGIPLEQQRRIFEPFERGTATTQTGGLGLGLFIVAQIVYAHRGALVLESQPGQGATFKIRLPCEQSDQPRGRRGPATDSQPLAVPSV